MRHKLLFITVITLLTTSLAHRSPEQPAQPEPLNDIAGSNKNKALKVISLQNTKTNSATYNTPSYYTTTEPYNTEPSQKQDQNQISPQIQLAHDYLSNGDYNQAANLLEDVVFDTLLNKDKTTDIDAFSLLRSAYEELGIPEEYRNIIDLTPYDHPLRPDIIRDYALDIASDGNIKDASDTLEKEIALNPKNTSLKNSLSDIYTSAGQWAAAEHQLLESLQIEQDPAVYYRLGQIYTSTGSKELAEEALSRATITKD